MTWTVHHAECLGMLRAMPDKSVDHIITDPPYSERVHRNLGKEGRGDGRATRDALTFGHMTAEWAKELGREFGRIARRWVLVFGDEVTMGYWLDCGVPWVRAGYWVKTNGMPQMSGDRPGSGVETISIMHAARKKGSGRMRWNGGGKVAVWLHGVERSKLCATPKPEALMLDLMADFTDPGDTVLDPFAASGTTGVAAIRLGRSFVGIERSEPDVMVARERLAAEARHLTIHAARLKQASIFDLLRKG